MPEQAKVSVFLWSYNHAKYLREAIDSVLEQTFSNFELFIMDDASTDESWAIINGYSDPRIHAFRNKTNQFGDFPEVFPQAASGDYIAIHHSDDAWEPEKLEKQVHFLDNHLEVGAVFSRALIIGENGEPFDDESHFYHKIFDQPNRTRYEWLNYFFFQGNALCHPSALIRKACYDECGIYRYGFSQAPDFDMWVRLCLVYEIYVMPEKLTRFRVRENMANTSSGRQENNVRSQFEYFQVLDNYRHLSNYEEMAKIFPTAGKYYRTEGFDAQAVLGMIALETEPFKFTELFGLQLLFEALNNPLRAAKINDLYHFDIHKFRELAGAHDVFSFVLREQWVTREHGWNIQLADFRQAIEALEAQKEVTQAQLVEKDDQLAEKDDQLVEKDGQLAEKNAQLHEVIDSKSWKFALLLRRIRILIAPPNSWRTRLLRIIYKFVAYPITYFRQDPKTRKIRKDLALIKDSGLFDAAWYVVNNPDVVQAKIDPARHYLLYGGFEGRDPSPHFCSGWYLDVYKDVKAAGVNPLVHYQEFGRNEERKAHPNQVADILITQTGEMENAQSSQFVGTGRYRITQLFKRVLRVYREEGLRALLRKGAREIIRPLQPVSTPQYAPKVSIVIPVFNAVAMTKDCLESIYRETSSEVPFEVIVIDNASQDITPQYLNEEKQIRAHLNVLSMEKNIGFGPAVNHGIQRSKGDFIVILNNDTMVSPGWLEKLLAPFESDPSIGIVSPMTNYVGEGPQIDTDAKDLLPDSDAIAQYAKSIASRSDVFYEPNRLVFFCVILRRELVDMIGYLDEGYEKGNFEDDDYCLRTRMAGYKLAIAGNSFVYHHGSATFTKNRISHSQYMELNRIRFYKKAGRIAIYQRYFTSPQTAGKNEVSVIIRTKNRPELLKRALTSMANQTFKDFEVVLVNDGGDDLTSLLSSFEPQFPIRYVHHVVSKGRTAAVNAGIQNSRGNWMSYLDDDDILYPWHLETLFQAAQNSNSRFVYSNFNRALFLGELNATTPDALNGAPPWEYSRRELLIQNYIPIHTWLHHRECVEKTGLWDETFDRLEDYEFLLRVSKWYDFHHLKKVTCEYRYYLNSANSIYTDRHRTVTALEQIYQRNPVVDSDLRVRRQGILDAINDQVHQIEKIQGQIGISISKDKAVREIIRLVAGI